MRWVALLLVFVCIAAVKPHKGAHAPKVKRERKVDARIIPPGATPTPSLPVITKGAYAASTKAVVKSFVFMPPTLWLTWGEQDYVWIAWDKNPEKNISYKVWSGRWSRIYDYTQDVRQATLTQTPADLRTIGAQTFYAVTAYDTNGLESDFSAEIYWTTTNLPPAFVARLSRAAPTNSPVGTFDIESKSVLSSVWQPFATVTDSFLQIIATETRFFRVKKR